VLDSLEFTLQEEDKDLSDKLDGQRCEVDVRKIGTLHDFRRTVTGDLLDNGGDIASVASLLGHASVNTTAHYDRRRQRARIAAAQLVSVPYKAA
jgi:integrase